MDTQIFNIATLIGILVIIILQIVCLVRNGKHSRENNPDLLSPIAELKGYIGSLGKYVRQTNKEIGEVKAGIEKGMHDGFVQLSGESAKANARVLSGLQQGIATLAQENRDAQGKLIESLQNGLNKLQETTEQRLGNIQSDVTKKLDVSLNQRLDENFSKVTRQLTELYKSLGELSQMSDGIQSLNRTLSNVKARGTWGEVQLDAILAETMPEGQYEKNVKLSDNTSDFVEFAVKIPSKENSKEYIYLPIDSKFPMDRYEEVVAASNSGDPAMLQAALRSLSDRIKIEARKIRDKYIIPPKTTDFAILFLPTESLYAEVLRINGLAEYCQNEYRIVISGPTTITALMNSLRIGFANLALNEKTGEIRKLLQAVKTQYGKFDELIESAQKRLNMAVKSTSELKNRTRIIRKQMSKIDELDTLQEADEILRIKDLEFAGEDAGTEWLDK